MNRDKAVELLRDAEAVVVVAGDKVPSVHLHAVNGSQDDIARAMACARGRRYLLGPMATWALSEPASWAGLFDAVHTHTVTSGGLALGSRTPAPYGQLGADRESFTGLIEQMPWSPVAERELYCGCTRKAFCRFCNEPGKAPAVAHRTVEDVSWPKRRSCTTRGCATSASAGRPASSPTRAEARKPSAPC
ncbi:hypothetical protein [Streptomyces sp. NPDC014995]|uniref:hypothetical protein n=1 Tax=Streptomyces sp. NPDC014995 TaxID=3364936 RepID=UPI003702A66A